MAKLWLSHVYKVYPSRDKKPSIFKRLFTKDKSKLKMPEDFVAVKDFSFEIDDGEFVVFVGPSGCGKSTTLRMIAGLEDITAGELYMDDVLLNNVDPMNRDMAMVFQSYALYPHLTAYDNIAFGLRIRKTEEVVTDEQGNQKVIKRHFTKAEIDEKVQWAAEILGIKELLGRRPSEMSGGQCQRVALGRALVRGPKVFLLDEPLSNLDAKLRTSMRGEIVKLHKRLGTTFIYVTHDQVEAMTMGTKIIVMKDGVIQQIGTPKDIYNHPNNIFVATFIGSPAMNILPADYDNGVITLSNGFKFQLSVEQIKEHDTFYENLKEEKEQNIVKNLEFIENKRLEYSDIPVTKLVKKLEAVKSKYESKILSEEKCIKDLEEQLKEETVSEDEFNKAIAKHQGNIVKLRASLEEEKEKGESNIATLKERHLLEEEKALGSLSEEEKEKRFANKQKQIDDYMSKDYAAIRAQNELEADQESVTSIKAILEKKSHEIIIGIRPEGLVLENNMSLVKNKSELFETEITLTELLGNEYYIHGLIGDENIICKCGADMNIETCNKVKLCLNFDQVHLFDKDTKISFLKGEDK